MLNKVSVLFPFGTDHGPREQNFNWTKRFYEKMMPEVEICIGESRDQPFSRSQAINHAAAQATRDIFAIADTDIIYDPVVLIEAIKLLDVYTWVLPFDKSFNMDKQSSEELLKLEPGWPLPINVNGHIPGQIGYGLLNVIPRKHFEAVGGFDERFLGWGGEDDAFAASVNGLCGWLTRMNHTAYHLWHPPGDYTYYGENLKYLKPYYDGIESVKKEIEKRKK
ncbi:galactosyltransferase-related protein [Neobacillus sp. NRS-1170]|uniref:galactosyltransferase-related protein n=1 Tax=Neobacillus sp. NRS-1170 TaxID=3233898 RepID=UPI003D27E86B